MLRVFAYPGASFRSALDVDQTAKFCNLTVALRCLHLDDSKIIRVELHRKRTVCYLPAPIKTIKLPDDREVILSIEL